VCNNGVLHTMYSVLERYCHAFQDENVERELAIILEHTTTPVLQLFTVRLLARHLPFGRLPPRTTDLSRITTTNTNPTDSYS